MRPRRERAGAAARQHVRDSRLLAPSLPPHSPSPLTLPPPSLSLLLRKQDLLQLAPEKVPRISASGSTGKLKLAPEEQLNEKIQLRDPYVAPLNVLQARV